MNFSKSYFKNFFVISLELMSKIDVKEPYLISLLLQRNRYFTEAQKIFKVLQMSAFIFTNHLECADYESK